MNNSCLIKQLKGEANANLPFFDLIEIGLDFSESLTVIGDSLMFNKGAEITVSGSAYFTDSNGTENYGQSLSVTKDVQTSIYVKDTINEVAKLYIPQYSLINIGDISTVGSRKIINIADFHHCSELVSFIENIFYGETNFGLLPKSLKTAYCVGGGGYAKATTEILSEYTGLKSLQIGGIDVTGDISDLSSLTSLTNIRLNGDREGNSVHGEINDMVQGMIANGRTSGNISGRFLTNGNITLNGSTIANTNISVSISNGTAYSVTCNNVTYSYVKNGDNWELQS